jgi:hypothetical protein
MEGLGGTFQGNGKLKRCEMPTWDRRVVQSEHELGGCAPKCLGEGGRGTHVLPQDVNGALRVDIGAEPDAMDHLEGDELSRYALRPASQASRQILGHLAHRLFA